MKVLVTLLGLALVGAVSLWLLAEDAMRGEE